MVMLGELCTKLSSNIAQKDLDNRDGIYPIYGASGLIKYVDFYQQEKSYVAVVKDGAGVGRVMCLPEKSSVIGTMQYIIPNEGVNVSYLAYAMEHMRLEKYYTGATIPHIYFKDYSKERLQDHDADEQRQISTVLDKLSDLIFLRKQQLAKLDEAVKSQFIEMFIGKGYPTNKLGEVCTVITDGTHKTPVYQDHGITFISAKNIIDGKVDFADVKYISQFEYQEIQKRCRTETGDVLLTKSGTLGAVALVDTDQPLGLFESLALLKYDREQLNGIFLKEQLRSNPIQLRLLSGMKGVAVKHLHLNVISETEIVVPPLTLQQKFAAFARQSDKSKLTIQQSLDKLETLKKLLMQQYFG